ncbi:hypothetical protein EUGRSUZ_H00873 [Eucalyptus grandis]|uniref:Uncharacterized protein n=2 Tax=Eucalyptus grandis TaxID=71139 RepID=A0ACC3JM43_EUCGR|nr:hypothetical protein EUGRSUZ_H00873 [Eucalyptus grandis]
MAGNNNSGIQQIQLLNWHEDSTGGVTVVMKERMDAGVFARWLRASISTWKQQGKKVVCIKLLAQCSNLVGIIEEEGFRYHHSEASYSVFVPWLPLTPNLIPVNASHGVRVIAFVLVVPENSGRFKGTRKLPTGVVNEDEDICHAVARVAKEETGVSNEFYVVQDHKSFFPKSDLSFLCVLQPQSSSIEEQNLEVRAAQWMPIEEYAAQPFIVKDKQFNSMAKICLARANYGYPGFTPLATTTRGGKRSHIYCNNYLGVQEDFASFT